MNASKVNIDQKVKNWKEQIYLEKNETNIRER